jgi:hypothetical protein
MSILQSFRRIRPLLPMRFFLFAFLATSVLAQTAPPNDSNAVRVNVTVNPDGSRTTYQFDTPNHKATAITTEPDGKPRGKTVYRIDDQGRFATGVSFDAKGKFRFKSLYKYDGAGRIQEETQLSKDDAVMNKIVYSYDTNGRQTGYSVFDAAGKLLGQTSTTAPAPSPRKK